MESRWSAGRSPMRVHLPRRQQPSISSAASSHMRHLHQVAVWASLFVPPLGAFLGSRLASTSEFLGCPPPSSPQFTCQRCESILQVGINCSVRVRTRKLKKRTKGINSIIYSCHYCAFESLMPGTSKAYVKTKLSEVAARSKLSESYQSLDVCVAEKVTQRTKMNSSELLSSSKVLSTETPGSTSKRTKRKGWLTLKQLSASPADSSLAGSRPIFSPRSAESPLLLQLRRLDSARVMPTVSQVDLKCLTPTSGLEGEFLSKATSIKTMLELGPSEGDIGSEKMVNFNADLSKLEQSIACTAHVMHSSGDTTSLCVPQSEVSDASGVATSLWSDADVISRNVGEFLENPPANAADSFLELQQSDASGITMNVEDEGLQQKLSIHHSEADTVLASISNCSVQDTMSMFEAQCSLSGAVLQTDLEIVAPTSIIQGPGTNEDERFNSSCVKSVVDANILLMVENGIDVLHDKDSDFPVKEKEATGSKIITVNSSIVKAVASKKRHRDDDDNCCKFFRKEENCKPEADRLRLGELDIKETSGMMSVELSASICKNRNTQTLPHERKANSRTKKKPLFRRVGRQWFTICKSNRTCKWRII